MGKAKRATRRPARSSRRLRARAAQARAPARADRRLEGRSRHARPPLEPGRPAAAPLMPLAQRDSVGQPRPRVRLPYLPAVDGLRALAVVAVVLYHSGWHWAVGGHLGVEVFFVISGYLITSLLLKEWQGSGDVSLRGFWLGRARRLLPALGFLLLGCLTYAVLLLPSEVARLRGDALAAAAYASNWYMVLRQQSYFEIIGRPSLLRHLWSLAVEEQYYLLWPIAFWALMRVGGRRLTAGTALLLAASSAMLMALLHQPDADPSRVYYGTDTRAAGLLVGSVLALVLPPRARRASPPWWQSILPDCVGSAALGALVSLLVLLDGQSPYLYRGGFAAVALLSALVIAAGVCPVARLLPAVLGWRPLRWLASRSYAVYLWHWPVFVLTLPYVDVPLDGLPLLFLRLAATLGCAEISYRVVEHPIRTGAYARAWRRLMDSRARPPLPLRMAWTAGVGSATFAVTLLFVTVGSAQWPGTPAYLRIESIDTLSRAATPAATPTLRVAAASATLVPAGPFATATPSAISAETQAPASEAWARRVFLALVAGSGESDARAVDTGDVRQDVVPTATREASPSPLTEGALDPVPVGPDVVADASSTPVAGHARVSAIGDSVMLGAADALQEAMPTIGIDAAISRQAAAIIEVLAARRDAGELGDVVVVHLGNSGSLSDEQFDEMMEAVGESRQVVVVNAKVPREWEGTNNTVIAEGVGRYDNAVLVDWHQSGIDHPEYFWDDGIHLRPEGAEAYAAMIADAVASAPTPAADAATLQS